MLNELAKLDWVVGSFEAFVCHAAIMPRPGPSLKGSSTAAISNCTTTNGRGVDHACASHSNLP